MGAPRASTRSKRIAPFEVMDIVAAARRRDAFAASTGADPVLHLEVGQPSAGPPEVVLDAARRGLDTALGYTDALGTTELREAIAGFHRRRDSTDVPADRVVVTSGASAGCVLAFAALCDPGERIAVFEPGYPCYRNTAEALGIEVRSIALDPRSGYIPSPAQLDQAMAEGPPLRAVVVASPSNPTGTALGEDALNALHEWCHDHDATLVVDEIYHGTATTPLPSATRFEDTIVVQSFSKYFCMTGWRLGWLTLPEALMRPVEALQQNLYLSPHALSQVAALAALGATDELDAHAYSYAANRATLTEALREAGVNSIAPAHGAFYVWADLGAWGTSDDLCTRWLEEIGVAATPGRDFDSHSGDSFVRFSVAGSPREIGAAAERLGSWLTDNRERQTSASRTPRPGGARPSAEGPGRQGPGRQGPTRQTPARAPQAPGTQAQQPPTQEVPR